MLLYVYSEFLDAEIARLEREEAEQEQLQLQLQFEANRAATFAKDFLPSPPYKGNIEGYLAGILLGGTVIGYEELTVTAGSAVSLTPPDKAKKAILVMEADQSTTNLRKVARYKVGDVAPTSSEGIPISDEAVFEIGMLFNLNRFKVIGIQAGKTHKIQVEYQG
jgi:hypothetical protein